MENTESQNRKLLLSVVIPARDEAGGLQQLLTDTANIVTAAGIPFELLIVDDYSKDSTAEEALKASTGSGTISCIQNQMDAGIGKAIEYGIQRARGDIIAIMMADGSDDPLDLVRYYEVINDGFDCAFGSRFSGGAMIDGYPVTKLLLNRLGNWLVALTFRYSYDDFTNAFKAYRTSILTEILPLRSQGFEVTLELPIRVVQAGASFKVVPISWQGRVSGHSKMRTFVDPCRYLHRLVSLWTS